MTMPRAILLVMSALLTAWLSACAAKPPVADWQMDAKSGLERATTAYLDGQTALEAVEFARARAELARTGRPELVARAELLRCASRVASLEFDDCPGYAALAPDAAPADQAYARYLAGRADAADAALLPEAQRAVAGTRSPGPDTVAAIADPLSALVAAGVAVRRDGATPALAAAAVDRASAQGWRRPLLAWLQWQQRAATAAGDAATAARLQRRIDLVGQSVARPSTAASASRLP